MDANLICTNCGDEMLPVDRMNNDVTYICPNCGYMAVETIE